MTITHKQYMENSNKLHHAYFLQFASQSSYYFIKTEIGINKLMSSTDEHLNDLYKHSKGGSGSWIWDSTPIKIELLRELGEVNSPSTHTCVGKAVAKELINEAKKRHNTIKKLKLSF